MTPSRVLVRMPNWLGDIVMALPALGAIRGQFAGAVLLAAAPAPFSPLLAAVPGVDETVALEPASGLTRLRADARSLAGARADLAILFTNSFGSAFAAWRAGIPQRWGYRADARRVLLTRGVSRRATRRGGTSRHHSHYYLRLLRGLGIDAQPGRAEIVVPRDWRERAARLLAANGLDPARPLVGIAPGAAYGRAKRWPPEYVARLASMLVTRTGAAVVLLGAAGDRETGHEIESGLRALHGAGDGFGVRAAVGDLIGRTDVPTLAGLMACCRAFVSNDSGAMHLASAVGVHVTAIFGPTREWATAPLGPHTIVHTDVFCRPCMLRECPIDHRCMKRLPPDVVFDSVAPHVQGSGG